MEIQSANITSTISLSSIVRAASGQGRVSFPVSPGNLVHTNLKNINVVPSFDDTGSYSISRLRALDNLIEQLNRMKSRNKIELPEAGTLNSDVLNSLISELSEEIHTKLDVNSVYKPSVESTGLLFNMLL